MTNKKKKNKKKWICFYCHRLNESGKRKCVYCGRTKVGDKRQLEKKLDRLFSMFVRRRDNYICVTCGRQGNEAGHYIGREVRATRWDERNVNCQCTYCNKYKHGNLTKYAIYLERKFGVGILEELDQQAKTIFNPTREWLLDKIEKYKAELKGEK